ncbi:potassium/sodium efflux p-type atpase [Fusarium flagelliforme]|uniref:P-type Na(+) transporter n=1 Tax=Fusarium flagelliforme TaxID=2675880 RepID=A0A395MQQ9_9HYPO|nr:potassium/sodium efflux p-type atpase [Fusarium flagelliforme]
MESSSVNRATNVDRLVDPARDHVSGQSNEPLSLPAHCLTVAQVADELRTNATSGLSANEAKDRLVKYGSNDLGETEGISPLRILFAQVANAMTMVLILAMAVSYGIQSWIEGGVVTAVILLNIIVGFFQEYSAEKTMDSLRSLSSPTASAIRQGESVTVQSSELVPGDLVELKTGDTIPADVRVFEAVNFETDEALLTGESLPVRKNEVALFPEKTGPGDRLNVAYSSSNVTKGRAKGIVFATGVYTEIGVIASELRKTDSKVREVKNRDASGHAKPYCYLEAYSLTVADAIGRFLGLNVGTPLQRKLSKLAVLLFCIAVLCAIIVLAANELNATQEVIIYAVATGLSMIPASLVVVLTITMAAGTKRMVKRHVIVRNLKSLEALGAVTDICSDKTGTLTQGKMIARGAWVPAAGTYSVDRSTSPLDPTAGDIHFYDSAPCKVNFGDEGSQDDHIISPHNNGTNEQINTVFKEFLNVACFANLATVAQMDDGSWDARGDPTEIAIQVFARRFNWDRSALVGKSGKEWTEVAELPFDSDVKRMSVVMRHANGEYHVFTKGAVERVIESYFRPEILENKQSLAKLGLRVLALASKPMSDPPSNGEAEVDRATVESDLIFRGLIGLYDPPRPESAPAVRQCHEAGIEVHMLTGDHPETAKAIAIEVGILPSKMHLIASDVANSMVMTAATFDTLSDGEVDKLPVLPLVIARCAPSTKVRMIEALHRRKRFCAMTGDGVNDSPSLRRADVGIAMGMAGSDVAKDASDIVLSDDNFASILAAIEEGRRIFDNIQKFVLHVLAENVAQAGTLLIGLAFKYASGFSVFPLAPVQVVWIIMATSGLPDMGLGFERAVPDILSRPPQSLKPGIFTTEFLVDMVLYGLWITLLCLSSFSLVMYGFGDGSKKYFTQWMFDVWRNQFLFWAIIIGFVTLFPLLYIPTLNTVVFKHLPITWEWGIVFIAAGLFFAGVETWKWGKRGYFRQQNAKTHGQAWRDMDIEQRVCGRYFSTSDYGLGTTGISLDKA